MTALDSVQQLKSAAITANSKDNKTVSSKKVGSFKGNFVFRKKIHDGNKNGKKIRKRVTLSDNDVGLESITQPAISARITEARYDEQNLNEIMKEDFVCLLDGRHIMNEHK